MMMMINIILISVMARPFHRRRRGHCPSRQQALRELERLRPDQCEHDDDDDDDEEEDDDDDEEEEDDDTHADCNLLSVHVMPPDELSLVAASCYDLCSKKVGFYQVL